MNAITKDGSSVPIRRTAWILQKAAMNPMERQEMEQRLRLLHGGQGRAEKRSAERRRIAVPGQIVWKDAQGTTRMVPVVTRDVSDQGVSVDCLGGTPIPAFRLVYFQLDREARNRPDLPPALRKPSVLSAVFRVGPCRQSTGSPSDYALRLIVNGDQDTAPAVSPGYDFFTSSSSRRASGA